jgi:hypothetical protein
MVHQHMLHHILAHAHGHVGIGDADQRHVRQRRVLEEGIDAGAERKQDCRRLGNVASTPGAGFHTRA